MTRSGLAFVLFLAGLAGTFAVSARFDMLTMCLPLLIAEGAFTVAAGVAWRADRERTRRSRPPVYLFGGPS